jgi:hypothetical protein
MHDPQVIDNAIITEIATYIESVSVIPTINIAIHEHATQI